MELIRRIIAAFVNRLFPPRKHRALILVSEQEHDAVQQIKRRFKFYLPDWSLRECQCGVGGDPSSQLFAAALRMVPVLYAGQHDPKKAPGILRHNPLYWLNPCTNCREAWEWHELVQQHVPPPDVEGARRRLLCFHEKLNLGRFDKAYVFGTGPSLARATERDWSDGARIVCNTIVRDAELWRHIEPHFVVAADAGYHFSFVKHAQAFRADLKRRLKETDTLFVYPAGFDAVVRREFGDFTDRLIPVPNGPQQTLCYDFAKDLSFPEFHNILPRMLAIACWLADEIGLWGFDGRAPDAQHFWDNSSRHSYPELMAELREAYPAFFEEHVPKQDQQRYVRWAFGDSLEQCLSEAESHGKRFVMMHDTWTETLQRRRVPEQKETEGTEG